MPNRIIQRRSRSMSMQLTDCLQSLFALEFVHPSRTLYLISPWISNIVVLTSRYGNFRPLLPGMDNGSLRLAEALEILSDRGTRVRLICRPAQPETETFLRRLPGSISYRYDTHIHEKGLIGQHFYLRGSMNFTYHGIHLNGEHVELTTDPHEVSQARLEADQTWSHLDEPDSLP